MATELRVEVRDLCLTVGRVKLLLLVLAALPVCAFSPTTSCGYVTATLLTESAEQNLRHGCFEHQVQIVNNSTATIRSATVQIGESGGLVLKRTVRIEPLGRATVSLFQPPLTINEGHIGISINGAGYSIKPAVEATYDRFGSDIMLLLSRKINMDDFDQRLGIDRVMFRRAGLELRKKADDVSSWSDNWLSYTRYDGIVIAADEYAIAPRAVQAALDEYVRAGGVLVVLDAGVPSSIVPWPDPESFDAASGLHSLPAGFGVYVACPVVCASNTAAVQTEQLKDLWRATAKPTEIELTTLMRRLPIVDDVSVPVRGMLLVLILFTLTVGPINLLILAKTRRRMWFWWTVPAWAGLTTILILAYALITEGVTPTARYLSTTLLDQRNHVATTVGIAAFYCPVAPWAGLQFDAHTEVTPILPINHKAQRHIDQTQHQHFGSGWLRSRVPAYFLLRSSGLRQERLNIVRDAGGKVRVINGLGAAIKDLWIADSSGRVVHATALAPGAQATADPIADSVAGRCSLRSYYEDAAWWTDMTGIARSRVPRQILRPGTYVAVMDATPFLDKGLSGRAKTQAASLVIGIMDQEQ